MKKNPDFRVFSIGIAFFWRIPWGWVIELELKREKDEIDAAFQLKENDLLKKEKENDWKGKSKYRENLD